MVTRKASNEEPLELGNLIGGRVARSGLSQKCTATSKRTGKRCGAWALRGAKTCRVHGSATKKSKVAAARRIAEASGYAADLLVEFMADPTIDVKQRTTIAQDLLSRAGYSGKKELTLEVSTWEKHMEQVVVEYTVSAASDDANVEDAVIVSPLELEAAEDDDELRALEARRLKRKRRTGSAYTLPSEEAPKPKTAQNPTPLKTPDWYAPDTLPNRLQPRRPKKRPAS
jgi:hypothetical protein